MKMIRGITALFLVVFAVCVAGTQYVRADSKPTPTPVVNEEGMIGGVTIKDTDDSFAEEGSRAYDELREKQYNKTLEVIEQLTHNETGPLNTDYVKLAWIYIFHVYDGVASIYWAILILSPIVGFIIYMLSTENKRRRRFAVAFFVVGLPLVAITITIGVPELYLRFV